MNFVIVTIIKHQYLISNHIIRHIVLIEMLEGGHSPYLGGHVEHHGDDGRVLVAVDDEAHLSKPLAEIDRVLCQLSHALTAWGGRDLET